MPNVSRGKRIIEILERKYGKKYPWLEVRKVLKEEAMIRENEFYNPFKNLIITILSQNTNDRNSTRAYVSLSKKFKIIPDSLAKAREREIAAAIKVGGLYNLKARRIKEIAKTVKEKYKGNLKGIINMPEEEARKELMRLPGVGNKTADVFLAYCSKKFALPIDTHINRVTKRLGIARPKATYEEMQGALKKIISRRKRPRGHEILIMFGRGICTARKPKCYKCPVEKLCPYPSKNLK